MKEPESVSPKKEKRSIPEGHGDTEALAARVAELEARLARMEVWISQIYWMLQPPPPARAPSVGKEKSGVTGAAGGAPGGWGMPRKEVVGPTGTPYGPGGKAPEVPGQIAAPREAAAGSPTSAIFPFKSPEAPRETPTPAFKSSGVPPESPRAPSEPQVLPSFPSSDETPVPIGGMGATRPMRPLRSDVPPFPRAGISETARAPGKAETREESNAAESTAKGVGATTGAARAPRVAEFLTRQEYREGPRPKPATASSGVSSEGPPEETAPWEVRLATTWLPRIGGVLLIVGVAFASALIQPHLTPAWRVVLGYVLAAGVATAGYFTRTRHATAARVTISIGVAVAYFVSFASHYIPPMRILPALPALGLMAVFAAALVGAAERWKSESTAGVGFLLGVIAALVSARTSQGFSLVALSVLSIAAGLLLVRNEWIQLTGLAVVGTYLSTLALWFLSPPMTTRNEVFVNLGALVLYHVVFTAAFWRWGRVAMARERAAREAELHEAVPALLLPNLPYSTQFAILNSVGVAALSIFLFWHTKILWPQVYWLLFALAAAESARLFLAPFSRGTLTSFHALTAFSLVCAGVVAATSGLTESSVLGAEALAVGIAATRSERLRFLRPLTIVCAALAVISYNGMGFVTGMSVVEAMIAPAFLLASALPLDRIWVPTRRLRPPGDAFDVLDTVSNHLRSLVAAWMAGAALVNYFRTASGSAASLAVIAIVLLLGIILLRAWSWFVGAVLAGCAALSVLVAMGHRGPGGLTAAFVAIAIGIYLWEETGRRTDEGKVRWLFDGVYVLQTMLIILFAVNWVRSLSPYQGLCMAAMGVGCFAVGLLESRAPMIRSLVSGRKNEEEDRKWKSAQPTAAAPAWGFGGLATGRFGVIAGGGLSILAVGYAVIMDARQQLVSAAVIAAVLAAGWWIGSRSRERERSWGWMFIVGATATLVGAILVFGHFKTGSVLAAAALGVAVIALEMARGSLAAGLTGLICLGVMGVLTPLPVFRQLPLSATESACGLLAGALLIAATRLLPGMQRRWGEEATAMLGGDPFGALAEYWLAGWGSVALLVYLAAGPFLPGTLITLAWGAIGFGLLALGFSFRDKPMRVIAILIFACAIGRMFIHDLAGASLTTRAIAFLGVGILLIGAGLAYAFLRKRVE